MLADLVSPFAMWGAICLSIGGLALWLYRRHSAGIVAEDDLDEVGDAVRGRRDALAELRATRLRMRASALRGWLRGRQGD